MADINLNALSQFISGSGAYAGFGAGGLGRSRWQSTRQDAYQAQLLYESDSYAGELVQNVVKFAIGDGLVVNFNNELIQAFWDRWPWNISSGLSRPPEMQALATTMLIRDGDIFGRKRPDADGEASPVLDFLEARYIGGIGNGGGSSQAGVKLDKQGRPVAYLYRPRLGSWDGGVGGGANLLRDQTEIPADEVIHAFRLEYAQQVRGLSWIRRAIWPLLALRAFDVILERAAELAILDRGYWTIAMDLLEDMTDTVDELDEDEEAGTATADTRAALIKEFLTRTDWDNIDKQKRLPEGMKWQPQPSAGITDSRMIESMRTQWVERATAGLGVSKQAVTDPSSRTFPITRVDLMKDYKFYTLVQSYVIPFTQAVVDWWAEEMSLINDAFAAEYDGVSIIAAPFPYLDMLKDAQGLRALHDLGVISSQAIIRTRGRRPEDVQAEIMEDTKWRASVIEATGLDPKGTVINQDEFLPDDRESDAGRLRPD